MDKRRSLKLAIPPQDLDTPTFSDGTLAGVTAWAEGLPGARPLACAKALHDALAELNRARTDYSVRFAILEALRPRVHDACTAVAGQRDDVPLMLDARARKIAALAQRTQYQLALGYKIAIVTALRDRVPLAPDAPDGSPTRIVVVAIHRALTELLHTLLRSLQFYTRPPASLWAQLHALYGLAELRGVHDEPVRDDQQALRSLTVPSDAYERAILLATAQPNQLRQQDLGVLFRALEAWTSLVRVVPLQALAQPVTVVDLASDGPPRSAAVAPAASSTGAASDLRTVDTTRLVQKLAEYLAGDPERAHPELPLVNLEHRELVRHCARVWGEPTDRAYERTPASGEVEICTGLEHVHFHAGGARSLLRQMQSERMEDEDPAEDEILDPFAGAADLGGVRDLGGMPVARRHVSTEEESEAQHPLHRLELADVSPIGYGLVRAGEPPEVIRAGRLVGIREADDPDWRITVVRWIANGRNRCRLGVETLAQRALSGGARLVSSRGRELDFVRALLLPGFEALAQPPSLVTAPGVFEAGQKIAFTQGGRETKLLVEASLASTDDHDRLQVRELVSAAAVEPETGIEFEVMSEEEERAAMAAFGLLDGGAGADDRS